MSDVIMGVFTDRAQADEAITKLETNGFDAKDISIVMKEVKSGETRVENAAEGAGSGAVTGGTIGGLAGLLVGLGVLTIPGLGAVLIGGPLAAALGLAGAAATTAQGAITGAVAGGLVGGLVGLGATPEEAKEYEKRLAEGAILVAVNTTAGNTAAQEILADTGADQIRRIAAK